MRIFKDFGNRVHGPHLSLVMACLGALVALLMPEGAYAWGMTTHIAIGQQILSSPTLDLALSNLLNKAQNAYLFGSLLPDIVTLRWDMLKMHKRGGKLIHSWKQGRHLLAQASTVEEQALAYGFLSHIAADEVAHRHLIPSESNTFIKVPIFNHVFIEFCWDATWGEASLQQARDVLSEAPCMNFFADAFEIKAREMRFHHKTYVAHAHLTAHSKMLRGLRRLKGYELQRVMQKTAAYHNEMIGDVIYVLNELPDRLELFRSWQLDGSHRQRTHT